MWPRFSDLGNVIDERLTGAACAGMAPRFDTDPLPGESDTQRTRRLADAGRVCLECDVRAECSTVAKELGRNAVGLWAGRARGQQKNPGGEQ